MQIRSSTVPIRDGLGAMLMPDRVRLEWRRACRATLGLVLPLLLARRLGTPDLSWVGVSALLLAIGDSTADGDDRQLARILTGSVLGGSALAAAVLTGRALLPAVLGMGVWGVVAGSIGAFGPAFAMMGLPVAWAAVLQGSVR